MSEVAKYLEAQKDLLTNPFAVQAQIDNATYTLSQAEKKLAGYRKHNAEADRLRLDDTKQATPDQLRRIPTKVMEKEVDFWTRIVTALKKIGETETMEDLDRSRSTDALTEKALADFTNRSSKWLGKMGEGTQLEISLDDSRRQILKFEERLGQNPQDLEAQRGLEYWKAFGTAAAEEKSGVVARVEERVDWIRKNDFNPQPEDMSGYVSAQEWVDKLEAMRKENTLIFWGLVGMGGVIAALVVRRYFLS
jgi:hypothetical protein